VTEVAKAWVTLIPSAKGFGQGINREIGADVDRAGRDAGKRMGEGISTGARKGLDKLPAAARTTGRDAGRELDRGFGSGLGSLARKIKLDLDASGFDVIEEANDRLPPGLGRIAKGFGGIGTAAAAVTTAGFKLALMAADVETAKVRLETLTGSAEVANEVFKELQAYSAKTPFRFEELQGATSRLLGAGVAAKDLTKNLENLGAAAAAGNGDIEGITTAYTQMLNKNRVTGEEMEQLSERGVPAWTVLAKAMGKSVAEVRQLSEQGKLGRKEVELLGEEMGKTWGGSVLKASQTLNGQLDTMKDTVTQIGQGFGAIPLVTVKDGVGIINDLLAPLLLASQVAGEFGGALDKLSVSVGGLVRQTLSLIPGLGTVVQAAGLAADAVGWLGEKMGITGGDAEVLANAQSPLAAGTEAAASAADRQKTALEGTDAAAKRLNQTLQLLAGGQLAADAATAQLEAALDDATKAATKNGRSLDLSTAAGRANSAALQGIATSALAMVDPLLRAGASTDQVAAKTRAARESFIAAAMQMGQSRAQAEKLADAYGLIPGQVKTAVELSGAQKAQQDARATRDEILGIPAYRTVTIEVRGKTYNVPASIAKPANRSYMGGDTGTAGPQSRGAGTVGTMSARTTAAAPGWWASDGRREKVLDDWRDALREVDKAESDLARARKRRRDAETKAQRKAATRAVRDAEASLAKARKARTSLAPRAEKARWAEGAADRLEKAQRALADVQRDRRQYADQAAERARGATDVTDLVDPAAMAERLKRGTAQIRRFTGDLEALRRQGVSEPLLEQIIGAGPEAGARMAANLRNASPALRKQVSDLAKQAEQAARGFGGAAGTGIYGDDEARARKDRDRRQTELDRGITINVYPRANQSEKQVAKQVSREIAWAVKR